MDRSREEWKDWLDKVSTVRGAVNPNWLNKSADEILLAIADERRKAREECCRAVCGYCAEGIKAVYDENVRGLAHDTTDTLFGVTKQIRVECVASAIRSLPASGTERGHKASIHDSKVHTADAETCWCKPFPTPPSPAAPCRHEWFGVAYTDGSGILEHCKLCPATRAKPSPMTPLPLVEPEEKCGHEWYLVASGDNYCRKCDKIKFKAKYP